MEEENIRKKLDLFGAKYAEERVQKNYTYDCYDPLVIYKLAVEDNKIIKSKKFILKDI